MDIRERLNEVIEKWHLLKHPFYEAWNDGTLSENALKLYASEYGNFISLIPQGWLTLGDDVTAQEEKEHIELWVDFANGLDTKINHPHLEETWSLISQTNDLFTNRAQALGALYAFEKQQPATSKSKLAGLRAHYSYPDECEKYFKAHEVNWSESERLFEAIVKLEPPDQDLAIAACERTCVALWQALSGIHKTTTTIM